MHFMQITDAAYWALANAGSRLLIPLAQLAAPAAVAAVWQGTAIAAVLALGLRLAPRVSAAHRYAVWAVGFAVVTGLPFLPLVSQRVAAQASASGAAVASPAATSWLQIDSRWGFAIAFVWLLASAVRAASLGMHTIGLHKLWKTAKPIEDQSMVASLSIGLPALRPLEICTTQSLDRPSVIGFFAPRILIPHWLLDRLTPAELEQVVLHETEHLRRRDDWFNLLQKIALVLFPLNLALVWMEGRLCREREMACDEGVVRRTQAPRAYAACLASLAERGLERRTVLRRAAALSLGAWQRRPELVHRVHSILRRKQALHPLAARALVGVVGCGLVLASVELARCPQMIAFVPPPKPASHSATPAPNEAIVAVNTATGAANLTQSPSIFHAVETKATLTATRRAPASAVATSSPRAASQPPAPPVDQQFQIASSQIPGDASQQTLLKAELPTPAPGPSAQPQFIVLAAWTETQTPLRQARAVADYDAGANVQQQAAQATAQPDSSAAAQIIVTRLILAVYPTAAAQPSAGAKKSSSSKPGRHAAPIADNDWLVFQL